MHEIKITILHFIIYQKCGHILTMMMMCFALKCFKWTFTFQLRGKSPPKPTSGRRSRDFAPSSSRSYKNAISPKFRENVRSTSQKSAKDTELYDYENTEVTFNSSRLDDTEFEETGNKSMHHILQLSFFNMLKHWFVFS